MRVALPDRDGKPLAGSVVRYEDASARAGCARGVGQGCSLDVATLRLGLVYVGGHDLGMVTMLQFGYTDDVGTCTST